MGVVAPGEKKIVCGFTPFSNKRNIFAEYHHVFGAMKRRLTKFFEYFRVSADTFDYILSKVHES